MSAPRRIRRLASTALLIGASLAAPLVTTIASAHETVEHETPEEPEVAATVLEVKPKSPWRGSTFTYEHLASALSVSKSAELTYNPYYEHRITFRPSYHFDEHLYTKARVDLEQEFTNADDTTQKHQLIFSDVWLWGGANDFKFPELWDLKAGADLMLVLPLSLASQAQTMRFGLGPGFIVSKGFDVLGGLEIGFLARWTFYNHHYTTSQNSAPWVACGSPDSPACGQFVATGDRNASNLLSFGPSVDLDITKDLSASLYFQIRRQGLYSLKNAPVPAGGGAAITTDANADVPARYEQLFIADVTYTFIEGLAVSTGVYGVYPELLPNSSYQAPLLNRFTEVYLDLTVKLDAFLPAI